MREIKFRAWDKKSKKMRTVESIGFGELSYYNEGYPVVNMIGRDCIDDKDIIIHRDSYQHELMQYTGLKDKNGKEIFEGDIIRYYHKAVGEIIRVVRYKYGMYGIEGKANETQIPFANILDSEREIIGNIYENPELLEGN